MPNIIRLQSNQPTQNLILEKLLSYINSGPENITNLEQFINCYLQITGNVNQPNQLLYSRNQVNIVRGIITSIMNSLYAKIPNLQEITVNSIVNYAKTNPIVTGIALILTQEILQHVFRRYTQSTSDQSSLSPENNSPLIFNNATPNNHHGYHAGILFQSSRAHSITSDRATIEQQPLVGITSRSNATRLRPF